jgi:Flp pilus assembly protein TadG
MRLWAERLRSERGQSTTEFAIVLPFLMVVIIGIVQGAVMFSHYLTLTNAVRTGARAAAIAGASGQSAAEDAASQAIDQAASGVVEPGSVAASSNSWTSGDSVTVTAKAPYSLTLFGVTVMAGDFTSTTTERIG